MKEQDKTKDQLIDELVELRQRITELERLETERKRAEKEIQQRTGDLTLINSLNTAINRGDSLQEIINLLAKETKRIFSSGGVTAYLLSEDKKYLVVQNLTLPPTTMNQIEKLIGMKIPAVRIPLKEGSLYLKATQAGKPQLINDPETIQGLMAECTDNKVVKRLVPSIYRVLGIRSVMNVPLVSEGEAIGLLDVSRNEPFAESDLKRFETISGQITAIIERKRAQEELAYAATHDALTGLPDRMLFNDRLTVALAHAHRYQQRLAVMLLDLDRFKDVNDTLGHDVGDQLLQAVGDRLTSLLRKSDTAARWGGDEFWLLLPEMARVEDSAKVAQRVMEAVREPLVLDGHELHITTSIGIAIYPDDGEDADTLMKNADIAMYRAKELGRNNYQRYTLAMNEKALE